MILDQEGGVPTALAIVDYKTSTSGDPLEHALQLQVYADAGRREGLDVRAAYVHDLKTIERHTVPVDESAVAAAEATVTEAADADPRQGLRAQPGCALPALRSPDDLPVRRALSAIRPRRPS